MMSAEGKLYDFVGCGWNFAVGEDYSSGSVDVEVRWVLGDDCFPGTM